MYVANFPSGEGCGNQSTVSELTSLCMAPAAAGKRAS